MGAVFAATDQNDGERVALKVLRDDAGTEALRRMYTRTQDRDTATTWATREAQYDAVCTWGIPDHAKLQRLSALRLPTTTTKWSGAS